MTAVIRLIRTACDDQHAEQLAKMLTAIRIELSPEELGSLPKRRMKYIMQRFLPLHKAILNAAAAYLPSPVVAQKYRSEKLYSGPKDDAFSAIQNWCV